MFSSLEGKKKIYEYFFSSSRVSKIFFIYLFSNIVDLKKKSSNNKLIKLNWQSKETFLYEDEFLGGNKKLKFLKVEFSDLRKVSVETVLTPSLRHPANFQFRSRQHLLVRNCEVMRILMDIINVWPPKTPCIQFSFKKYKLST